jgi:hypothetical protein
MDLQDRSGRKLGRVDDLIVRSNGELAYVVVSGNTPETMAKQIVVPWKSVRAEMANTAERRDQPMAGVDRTEAKDRLVLQSDKELAAAPSFDRTRWPNASDTTAFTESDRYFGNAATAGMPDDRTGRPVEAGANRARCISSLR